MRDRARELSSEAKNYRNRGKLSRAGNAYTGAAHEYAGSVEEHIFPECDYTADAVSSLCKAATCYRIVGDEFRTENRCDIGILLARDYANYIEAVNKGESAFGELRRGAWPEFIGDLRTIAGMDDADDAYDRAQEIYESSGEWEFVFAEEEHTRLAGFFLDVRRGLGHEIEEDAPERRPLDGPSFVEWLEYKRDRLPDLLDQLEEQGEWPVD